MKVFPLLKTVLDEVMDDVPGTAKQKRVLVEARAAALREGYGQLAVTKAPIDYKDPATRYAYIRNYVTSHSNMVADIIKGSPELRAVFKREQASVCCIGGGPGSDLVGVLKYVENAGIDPRLLFWLFDREQAWNDSWADVNLKLEREVSTNFTKFDVTDPASYASHAKYLRSDLFTMVYFLSEVHHCRKGAMAFFENLFAKAKKGALFLYIDNCSSTFYDWFDDLWETAGLTKLSGKDKVTMWVPNEEQKSDLGSHFVDFAGAPKLHGDVAVRVLRKE